MTVSYDSHNSPMSGAASSEQRRITPFDFALLASVTMLLGIGAVMVYSATINDQTIVTGDGAGKLKVHLIHVALGVTCLLGGMYYPYRNWRRLTYPILFGSVLLLVAVIFFGHTAGNARRWIKLPGFSLQPAEVAKLAFVMFLAYSLAKKAHRIRSFTVAFVPHLLVCGLLIFLCLFQPDFGTSVILTVLMFTMLFVAGTRLSYISLFVLVGSFLAFQAIAANDMRLRRVIAFINPWAYRSGTGYQMVNSQIAIGSGGLTGQGLGYGGQTLTGFLPEGHTDFILSVTAEQMGFVGVSVIALLFVMLIARGIAIASSARDSYGRFLAFGITLLLGLQAVINMMVAVGLIPTKGLTLPFVSYGGSSMLVCCLALGILLNISRDVALGKLELVAPPPSFEDEERQLLMQAETVRRQRHRKKRKTRGPDPRQQSLEEVLKP